MDKLFEEITHIKQNIMNLSDVIYNILTRDPRTSVWQGFSNEYGSLCHVRTNELKYWEGHGIYKDWNSELFLFKSRFKIPKEDRIIFHRDNTFLSTSHDQGLVITDEGFYYIPDNDYPQNRSAFSWATLKQVSYDGENMVFDFNDGVRFPIPMKFFVKKHDYCGKRAIAEIGRTLAEVFNHVIMWVNAYKK